MEKAYSKVWIIKHGQHIQVELTKDEHNIHRSFTGIGEYQLRTPTGSWTVHNDNSPAIECAGGHTVYMRHGHIHREDGPAIINDRSHYSSYYINDLLMLKADFEKWQADNRPKENQEENAWGLVVGALAVAAITAIVSGKSNQSRPKQVRTLEQQSHNQIQTNPARS